jgi:hypothetical protein
MRIKLARRLFWPFGRRIRVRAKGYGREVLFSGWVELPAAFRPAGGSRQKPS